MTSPDEALQEQLNLSLSMIIGDKNDLLRRHRRLLCFFLLALSGVYTSNLFDDLDFYLGRILSLYEAKYLGQMFSQTFCFTEGQYLAQIKLQIIFKNRMCRRMLVVA